MAFQTRLTTKLDKYSVGNPVIELKTFVDKEHLNQIIKNLLIKNDKVDAESSSKLSFDFIVGGRLLYLSIEKHLELYSDELDAKTIFNEKIVEIEYILSAQAPKPRDETPHDDWVSCIDANLDYIISGSYDNSIRIFSITDRKCVATLEVAHEKPITKVHWLRNLEGLKKNELCFVSCGHDESAILRKFNIDTLEITTLINFKGHNRSVNCIDSHDDLLATGSFDKTLRLWSSSLNDAEEVTDEQESVSVSSKRKKQKLRSDAKPAVTKKSMMTLTGHQESITGVKYLEFNSVATCSMDRTICFWDVEVGECKRRVLSAKPLLSIDYCCDHNLILSASCDKYIRAWDSRAPDNATAKTAYTSHNAWVSTVAFGTSSSNNFISGGYDNLVKLWDLRSTKACLYDLIGHHDKVLDVNWKNPDYVLSGSSDSTMRVFSFI